MVKIRDVFCGMMVMAGVVRRFEVVLMMMWWLVMLEGRDCEWC